MGRYVLDLQEIDETRVAVVGGKGAHLGELSRIEGLRVPAGFCVTTYAFQRIMTDAPPIDERLDRLSRLKPDDLDAIRALSAEIRRTVEGIAIPDELAAAITPLARPARRARRLRRPIQCDGGGLADGLLRGPAGHVPERRGAGGDPPARQPVLGLALHRAGRDLPPAQRRGPPQGPHGRGRAADCLPAGGRHPFHGRPRHGQPDGRLRRGQLRPRRVPGLRLGERRRLQGAGRRGRRQGGCPTTLVPIRLGNIRNCERGAGQRRFEHGRQEAWKKEQELLERLRALPDVERKAAEAKRMIDRVRTFVGYREYPKYGMVSRYFVYKQALLEEAERLVQARVLREKDDIFYLTFQELHDVVRTNQVDDQLVRQRKDAFGSYQALTPPRVLTSDGEVIAGSYRRNGVPAGALVGLPVSTGLVEGRARVVLDMAEANLELGDILVTAYTDPSWTPLFLAIGGLVTEVGA